jgi:hypothetical protein
MTKLAGDRYIVMSSDGHAGAQLHGSLPCVYRTTWVGGHAAVVNSNTVAEDVRGPNRTGFPGPATDRRLSGTAASRPAHRGRGGRVNR